MKRSQKHRGNYGSSAVQGRQTSGLLVPQGSQADYADEQQSGAQADDNDPVLQPPLWMFIRGGLEVFWGVTSNVIQAVTSFAGILGWQQSDTVTAYGIAKGTQLLLARNLGFTLVALVLSIGAQIGIQVTTQQLRPLWKQKRIEEHESVQQALIEVASNASALALLGAVSFLVCAVSDYLFVTEIDSTGSIGAYILMTFWALILGTSSTAVLTDGIQLIWSGVLAHRAWKLWQEALKNHFAHLAGQYTA